MKPCTFENTMLHRSRFLRDALPAARVFVGRTHDMQIELIIEHD